MRYDFIIFVLFIIYFICVRCAFEINSDDFETVWLEGIMHYQILTCVEI